MKKTILKFNMVVAVIAMMLLATSCIKTQSGVDKDELREIVTEAIHSVSTIETDSVSSSTVVFKGVESDADVDNAVFDAYGLTMEERDFILCNKKVNRI